MGLWAEIEARREGGGPVLIGAGKQLGLNDFLRAPLPDLTLIAAGDVVALLGDFDESTIAAFMALADRKAIIVPLTKETEALHSRFFASSGADWLLNGGTLSKLRDKRLEHPLLEKLRGEQKSGFIVFTSGTTGEPKAILHDLGNFLAKFAKPRPGLRTLNFLLFDHLGGLNTFFHALLCGGTVVRPSDRTPAAVLDDIARYGIELLPTTPTFLRLLAFEAEFQASPLRNLKLITYGAERMDQGTLSRMCAALPDVDFRQTYGLSELAVLSVRSRARDSLWISIGGPGVETRIRDGMLDIRSQSRMLGYLNAPDPFLEGGWYPTGDLVECDGSDLLILGRRDWVINVGGIKVLPADIEQAALRHPDVQAAKAEGVANPITGQHIEITCMLRPGATAPGRDEWREHFRTHLPPGQRPQRVRVGDVEISHRFKQR